MDFRNSQTTFPFIRCAMCSAQMTSPKTFVKDGVSRLLVKGDFDKLKSKMVIGKTLQAESLLQEAWRLSQTHGMHLDKLALPYGRFMIRMALFLVGKQSKLGHEVFDDMDAINAAFASELLMMKDKGVIEEVAPGSQSCGTKDIKPANLKGGTFFFCAVLLLLWVDGVAYLFLFIV